MTLEEFQDHIRRRCRALRYGDTVRDYWLGHPFCEVCEGYGIQKYAEAPHRLRTCPLEGGEREEELISLCPAHRGGPDGIFALGRRAFAEAHPHVKHKIYAVLVEVRA